MSYLCLIADRRGFVAEFYEYTNSMGRRVVRAKYCVDPRGALPFTSREAAEKSYAKLEPVAVDYHCTLALSREH